MSRTLRTAPGARGSSRGLWLAAVFAMAGCDRTAGPAAAIETEPAAPAFVGTEICAGCHADQAASWRDSHHALAMQVADETTVLGDFADAGFVYGDVTTRFTRRDGGFYVTTDGADGEPAEFAVRWTFGVEPLQQYLIETGAGRVQALSIAWDSRPAADGGQRWFHLYPDETIDHEDPLHWTGTYQRWNTMCADCHSTNLVKGYDPAADRFTTSFDDVTLGCESCHGPGSRHAADPAVPPPALAATERAWVFEAGRTIAARVPAGPAPAEGEVCAQCHSRRSQLRDLHTAGAPLLDSYRPALLEAGLYHADGQIDDEVYEYGSFLQSRMAAAGVTCSDCHEPHSATLRAEGNAVCAQCHLASAYDQPAHHRHEQGSAASACVSCHMREETYMVVDPRRDHSFRVPRPDLSAALESPNACNDCHDGETSDWAAARVAEWFPDGRSTEPHFGEAIAAGRRWSADARARLLGLLNDPGTPEIVRATALGLLAARRTQGDEAIIAASLEGDEPLLALAAIEAGAELPPERRVELLQRYLDDGRLALRIAAARSLLTARDALSPRRQADLDRALDEFLAAQAFNSDRPEGFLSRAAVAVDRGDYANGERLYREGVERFPFYPALYANLGDLYRLMGRAEEGEAVLREGLVVSPDSPALELALGFALVRDGRAAEALPHFERAAATGAGDPYYNYILAIAVNDAGDAARSLELLQQGHERFPGHPDTLLALVTLSRDEGDLDAARRYADRLVALLPGEPGPIALRDALQSAPGQPL